MKNKFPIKSATLHLPSREIQTNNKYFNNCNCTICNACELFEHNKFSCDYICKIWGGTSWQMWIAWLHLQMSNYLKKFTENTAFGTTELYRCHQFFQYFIFYQLWIVDLKHVWNSNGTWIGNRRRFNAVLSRIRKPLRSLTSPLHQRDLSVTFIRTHSLYIRNNSKLSIYVTESSGDRTTSMPKSVLH